LIQVIKEKFMEIRATREDLLKRINEGWEKLEGFLATLSDEQMTVPSDPAGWTVKDHLIHLGAWEGGIAALLRKESRIGYMGISNDLWENGGVDEINDAIFQVNKGKSLAEARQYSKASHEAILSSVGALSDDELNMPYKHYDPSWDNDNPVFGWVVGNTFEHYEEHTPWMAAIAEKL
jgi:hypothetical protein